MIQAPKGTHDVLPSEVYKWQYVESVMRELCSQFGYKEIRIPVFEHTELFLRSVGETTDIVQKEMYTFQDKGGRSITLRPEGTAGVVRSYIEHGMASLPQPMKMYYILSAYRYENVQKGRYREFNQFGIEIFGSKEPEAEIELISLISLMFEKLGIKNLDLNINSIGCPVCRKEYHKALKEFFQSNISKMCKTCNDRIDKNPMRILDCKEKVCSEINKDAPSIIDYLCEECSAHFERLKYLLKAVGIEFNVNPRIVRGLDYYTKTVFEFISKDIGAQGTVCGGGRYDGLVEEMGGQLTPGLGFGMGIERLISVMENARLSFGEEKVPELFIAAIGQKAREKAVKISDELRNKGLAVQFDLIDRSVKAQMKFADKLGAKNVIVLGDNEIESGKAKIKNMQNGEEKEVELKNLAKEVTK